MRIVLDKEERKIAIDILERGRVPQLDCFAKGDIYCNGMDCVNCIARKGDYWTNQNRVFPKCKAKGIQDLIDADPCLGPPREPIKYNDTDIPKAQEILVDPDCDCNCHL